MKKYILQIKFEILFQVLFSVLESLALASMAYLPKIIFDLLINETNESFEVVLGSVLLYCFLGLFAVGASYFQMLFTWKYAIKFENVIKKDYFDAIIQYDDIKFHKKSIAEYVSIQSNDIMQIEQDYLTPIVSAINQVIKIVVFGSVMFIGIDGRIAVIVLILSLIAAIFPKYTGRKTAKKRLCFVGKLGEYTDLIYDLFRGFREINSRNAANIIQVNEKLLLETKKARYDYGKNKAQSLAVNRFIRTIVQIVSFLVVIIFLYRKEISVGSCIATLGFINSFIDPLEEILYCFTTIETVRDVKEKVFGFLVEEKEYEAEIKKNLELELKVANLTIRNGNFLLNNISCLFEKNKHYAIVGQNGCGKSTLLNAIVGYLDKESGEILIDNKPLSKYNKAWLISYIIQDSHIFATDYKNNITMFNAYEDISDLSIDKIGLSEKLVQKIKEQKNGKNLSGGEKQILSYLRAKNANTPILIMDEPFSAVDKKSRELLMKDIYSLKDKTIIMITHDIDETLCYFDEIIELGGSKFEESIKRNISNKDLRRI